ncbi:hypothetical protein [Mameliella sediminis]|uniref:hypothetical protein n=1 Tax=Mameliella sediminis TaxID=2836866 RepID=UPI001C44536A|nr:hypothetical protein [Mameliella sediminis]MBY6116673.1 hypothetical protein [Antarctobacter heliothermus]MBY6146426.1 hypothetical protein [Mameliella alba]MBV7396766.1 hypothetical protein [Mameliella sediminis]MBY6163056.1 hypothetical protein [Mameliella alba]MBY6171320.1 hypothetical protein [Mameliella alba]
MYPEELIERAVESATQCEAQGFYETAKSLRALAQDMRASALPTAGFHGFAEPAAPAPFIRS